MTRFFAACALALALNTHAQTLTPEVTSWILNTTGQTGYNNIPSNVQQVQYSATNVYISATCVPAYNIGPWPGNPNTPVNQNFVYKITRSPQQNTGTLVNTPLGHIGVWTNGVSIFNAKDAASYNNMGIWNQNAIVVEGATFDACLGHPAPNGEYHHHLNPKCLYDITDSTKHSPIIGYAFDGFPIYGAYGYLNVNGTGGIKRIKSSYRVRNITARTTKPDGSPLNAAQYGPAINTQYPLGYYLEDFEYILSLGDLDEHNGRFCVTPEYPSGIYAYFATIDETLTATYPYTLGTTYYGTVQPGNTGPNSGHNTVTEPVSTYTGVTGVIEPESISFQMYPNPAANTLMLFVASDAPNNLQGRILSQPGTEVLVLRNIQPSVSYPLDVSKLANGTYYLLLSGDGLQTVKKLVINR